MYGAVDPVYMLMLIKVLGPAYVVWDKAASISFKKPGTSTLFAKFVLAEEELSAVKDVLSYAPSVERVYFVELVDAKGVVHAFIEKTVYIRKKEGAGDGKPGQVS